MIGKFQAPNGSFPEVGRVIHTDMQGGSSQGVALTAFVVTAFLEDKASSFVFFASTRPDEQFSNSRVKFPIIATL